MLEVKDKNLSALKCLNLIREEKTAGNLATEWKKYKYTVLEKSPSDFDRINKLFKYTKAYDAAQFYRILEHALGQPVSSGSAVNAAQKIWGLLRDGAAEKESDRINKNIQAYKSGKMSLSALKNNLRRLCEKYNAAGLLDSYYFENI